MELNGTFDESDFFGVEAVKLIDERVDLAVGGGARPNPKATGAGWIFQVDEGCFPPDLEFGRRLLERRPSGDFWSV